MTIYIYILLKMGGDGKGVVYFCLKRGNKREGAWIIRDGVRLC